jgi:endonuclease/exonuclease/phosphatase (EEP) superfamily protein YafD
LVRGLSGTAARAARKGAAGRGKGKEKATLTLTRGRGTALAAALVGVLAAGGCARSPQTPRGPHFTVLTYNVDFAMPEAEKTLHALVNGGTDVICLQEVTPDWEAYLRPRLKDDYPHMLFRHHSWAGGLAVLSRWPLEDRAYLPAEAGWFPAWLAVARTPIGDVQLLNVHLRPCKDENHQPAVGAYFSTQDVRLKEMQGFCAHLDENLPSVILGDFNEGHHGKAVVWLRSDKGYTNALREFDPWSPTWRKGGLSAGIDHILYSSHLHCAWARLGEAGGSNHRPVLASLERKTD